MSTTPNPPQPASAAFVNPTREQVVQWCVDCIKARDAQWNERELKGFAEYTKITDSIVPPVPPVYRRVAIPGDKSERLLAVDHVNGAGYVWYNLYGPQGTKSTNSPYTLETLCVAFDKAEPALQREVMRIALSLADSPIDEPAPPPPALRELDLVQLDALLCAAHGVDHDPVTLTWSIDALERLREKLRSCLGDAGRVVDGGEVGK